MSGYDVTADEFLLAGGIPSVKFENVGDTVTGVIVKKEMQQERDYDTDELKFYKDHTEQNPKPIMQLVLTLQTSESDPERQNDDGQRKLYVRTNLRQALAAAVRQAGATGIAVGAGVSVTHTGHGVQTNPKFKPPKLFKAVYVSPSEPETPVEEIETPKPEPKAAAPKTAPKAAAPKAEVPAELPEDAQAMLAQMMAAKA